MTDPLSSPHTGVPAKAAGARVASGLPRLTRDDAAYWDNRPEDHNARGLYEHGPQEAEPPANRLARLTRSRCREQAETPAAARGRMEVQKKRARQSLTNRERFLASLAGKRTRVVPTGSRKRKIAA